MGVAYGSTACMLSCAPMLMPLLVKNSSTLRSSMRVVGIFSMGRIFSYTLIAILASIASFSVKEVLNKPEITQPLMGLVMVFTALYLIYQQFFPATEHKCGVGHYKKRSFKYRQLFYYGSNALFKPLRTFTFAGCCKCCKFISIEGIDIWAYVWTWNSFSLFNIIWFYFFYYCKRLSYAIQASKKMDRINSFMLVVVCRDHGDIRYIKIVKKGWLDG